MHKLLNAPEMKHDLPALALCPPSFSPQAPPPPAQAPPAQGGLHRTRTVRRPTQHAGPAHVRSSVRSKGSSSGQLSTRYARAADPGSLGLLVLIKDCVDMTDG